MDANLVTTQVTSAAIVVWAIQKLKASPKFPWLKETGQIWLKRIVSAAAAIGTHTGISAVWNPGVSLGSHVLILSIPAASVVVVSVWHWIGQYVFQEMIYQVGFNRPAPAAPAQGPAK